MLLLWLPLLLASTIDWLSDGRLDCACDTFDESFLRAVGDDVLLTFEISSERFLLSTIMLLSRTLNFPAELSLLVSVYASPDDFSVKTKMSM